MSQPPGSKVKPPREPPPSLFLGPPSQNASHVSLPGLPLPPTTSQTSSSNLNPSSSINPNTRAPLHRQRDPRLQVPNLDRTSELPPAAPGPSIPRPAFARQQQQNSEGRRQADRADLLWAEMQRTLEDVKENAVSTTHVFGEEHAKALEELRSAQIGLAQAWARSEADDMLDDAEKESKGKQPGEGGQSEGGKSTLDPLGGDAGNAGKGSTTTGSNRPGSSGMGVGGPTKNVGDEMDPEILMARKRREANDRYFKKVNAGVVDVVAKLEEVAASLRAVEQESRDIWEGTNSAASSIRGSTT